MSELSNKKIELTAEHLKSMHNGAVVIPSHILQSDKISRVNKLVFGIFLRDSIARPHLDINSSYISNEIDLSRPSITTKINSLKDLDLIEKKYETPQEIKDMVTTRRQVEDKGSPLYSNGKQCEWCEVFFPVLDSHHYPKPKSKGGKEIVDICPNCHQLFHYFENIYTLSGEVKVVGHA